MAIGFNTDANLTMVSQTVDRRQEGQRGHRVNRGQLDQFRVSNQGSIALPRFDMQTLQQVNEQPLEDEIYAD